MTSSDPRPKRRSHPWLLNLVALAAVLVVNGLATSGALGGVTTGELSDAYPSLFTPPGYVFSIWGVIYALLLAFAVYQALPGQRGNGRLARLGYLFAASCAFNCGWIFAWQFRQILLSELLMVGLLLTLIASYLRLGIGTDKSGRGEALALQLPFRIYLGWISVATVANTAVLLLDAGVSGGPLAPLLTVLAIAAAAAVGYLVQLRRADTAFNLVLVWAFAGIAVKQWGAEPLIAGAALLFAAALVLAMLWLRGASATPAAAPG